MPIYNVLRVRSRRLFETMIARDTKATFEHNGRFEIRAVHAERVCIGRVNYNPIHGERISANNLHARDYLGR